MYPGSGHTGLSDEETSSGRAHTVPEKLLITVYCCMLFS